jgi:hypothetical protein
MEQVQVAEQIHVSEQAAPVAPALKREPAAALLTVLFVALVSYVALQQLNAPAAVGADAPAAEFSSARALKHVGVIARSPHALGTAAHAQVRDYILKELSVLGLSPEVQKSSVVNPSLGMPYSAGAVENIVARIPGTQSGKAVLFAGHYDSAPLSFGANDDGVAVAAMLETARAVKAGPPLKNDIILLFTDGEEAGLLGARAFVKEHPWAKDAGLVFNFDARGNSGPSIMFETSEQNGALVSEFARALPDPVTTSAAFEVYRLMPNNTDFTEFRRAGLAGLNFAYINGSTHYHSPLDTVANVDERSLQHHGSNALALARHFGGGGDGSVDKESNAVYFNLFGSTLKYAGGWVLPLAGLATELFVAVILLGLRAKQLTVRGVAFGVLAFAASALAASLAASLAWWGLGTLNARLGVPPLGDFYNKQFYVAAMLALSFAVFAFVEFRFGRKTGTANLSVGALGWWLLLSVATSILMPGASYLFTLPLIFGLVALFVVFLLRSAGTASAKRLALLAAGVTPGLLLLVPMIYFVYVAMGLSALPVLALLVALLLGLLLLPLEVVFKAGGRAVTAFALVLFVGLLAAGGLAAGYDEQHPRQDSIFYAYNADTRKAAWATLDEKLDAYTSQFFKSGGRDGSVEEYVPVRFQLYNAPAPPAALDAPRVEVLDDSRENDVRRLTVRVTSPRQAPTVKVYLDSVAEVVGASVDGKAIETQGRRGGGPTRWALSYQGLPPEGIELSLQVKSAEPLKLRVMDQTYQLPALPEASLKERPVGFVAAGLLPYSDSTLVSKSYTF